ncbi:alpha/beta hydrolase [Niameybacter massiliensis]|uniref:Alpha/beta hydrolase n=1 Tax=Holtiella tumoricola TaxID=3018743 RepID=A0AA42J1G1_9FIRM|nr:alpha/beta hydrolase [Holtiella tumoricola]MDA3732512.1 alpha/beta hydrolase [Holtiella tumoricola]
MKEQYITTSYGRIHLYSRGNGPKALVLLHGAGCDSAMLSWREIMEVFPNDYTIYAPDHLGYGLSDKPTNLIGTAFYSTHIGCLKEIIDALGLDQFALVGLSMGGAIAIGFALQYPRRVKYLIPVASWGLSPRFPFQKVANWYIYKTNGTLYQYNWLVKRKHLAKYFIGYSLIGNRKNITAPLIDEVLQACARDGAGKSMQDFQRSSCSKTGTLPFYSDELKRLRMPVIFFAGEKDPLVPLKDIKAALKKVPNGKLYIFPKCKHWAIKENPHAFVEIIQKYY